MYMQARFLSLILLSLGSASLAAEPARDRFGDPLPDGAVARLGSPHLRNEYPILTTAFSADGKSLLMCDTHFISIWDRATGKMARRVALKLGAGRQVRGFSADGKTLIVSGSGSENVLRFVDTATGEERLTLNYAPRGSVFGLDMSRDGKILASNHHKSIALWNVTDGKLLREFKEAPIVPVAASGRLALTADGKQLVLPHTDGSLHLVDTASGKEVRAMDMPPPRQGVEPFSRVRHLTLSPDDRYLAFGGPDDSLTVCELATGKRLHELKLPQGSVSGLAFTSDGRFLAVDNHTGYHLFGVLSGKEIRKRPKPHRPNHLLGFSPDGRTLVTRRGEHTIDLWDVADDRPLHPFVGHDTPVLSMVFFPDGKRLVATDMYQGTIVWDTASGRDLFKRRYSTHTLSLTVKEDGAELRFVDPWTVNRWNLKTNLEEAQRYDLGKGISLTALSPDGRSLAGTSYFLPRQVHLHNREDGKTVRLKEHPEAEYASQVVFSPDSRRLAVSSSDGAVRLWDRDTAALVRELKPATPVSPRVHLSKRSTGVSHLTFAADGRCLVWFDGAARIREIVVREIAGGGDRLKIPMPGGLTSLAYSADARFLAYGQTDGKILVYSAVSGKQLAQWEGKQDSVRVLAFSRDGRWLASGGENGTILVWAVPEGENFAATLKAEEAEAFWQALADEDAARANRALARLTAAPAQAVPLLKERVRAAGKALSAERMARLIAELDDESFQVRERAARELAEAGPDAADALRADLAKAPPLEKRRRLEELLARLSKGVELKRLRCLRALEVLERIGTGEAKDALRGLDEEDIGPALREEIRASLRRLDARR